MTSADVRRYLSNWQGEVDSAALYRAMAKAEGVSANAKVYENLASIEEKHAAFWEERLGAAGHPPGTRQPSWRARILMWCARRWGAESVLPTVASHEYVARNDYAPQRETAKTGMSGEERMHARVLQTMLAKTSGVAGSTLGRIEGRHHSVGRNTLRAAVLGANDGLCSNLALVMGVAGANVSERTVMLAGIAGLLAGACSMALGEWISVTSSRELAEREMKIERSELEANPEQEREELQLIYESKGLPARQAQELSARLLTDPDTALDVLAREELGIDPNDLGGSPWTAAGSSMLLFAVGAVIPLAPFFFLHSATALFASVAGGAFGLYLIGAGISVFTGRSALFSGARQLVLGLAAAGVTFAIGKLIGIAVAG
ncbi:MAG TPA: VIT1/CCC1 transporter family protein [Polyangiaceae bacterium]